MPIHCWFIQWIDGSDKFDPRSYVFPYDHEKIETFHEIRRWVPPLPNPALVTVDERWRLHGAVLGILTCANVVSILRLFDHTEGIHRSSIQHVGGGEVAGVG